MENILVKEYKSNEMKMLEVVYSSLWRHKVMNMLIILTFAVSSVFYSLSLPNVYRSTSVLIPTDDNSSGGLGAMLGQLGGLASMAGLNIGGGDAKSKFQLVELIRSRDFILSFIDKYDLKIVLFAAKGWDREANALIYDPAIYDIEKKLWVREVEPHQTKEPSDDESYEKFRDVFKVVLDKKKSLFTLTMDSYSPFMAKEWLTLYINDFNNFMKEKDIKASTDNLDFLNNYIKELPYNDLRVALFTLIEEQLKVLMLTKSKNNYALEVIQSAFVPDNKDSPKRAVICIAGTFLGGLLAAFISIFLYVRKEKRG